MTSKLAPLRGALVLKILVSSNAPRPFVVHQLTLHAKAALNATVLLSFLRVGIPALILVSLVIHHLVSVLRKGYPRQLG